MSPLVPYGVGCLAGLAACGFFYGFSERFQKIALAAAVGTAVVGGVLLIYFGGPATTGVDKRALALAGVGVAAKIGGYNLGIAAQVPSGGFSSARTESMIGFAVAAILLALSIPALKPA